MNRILLWKLVAFIAVGTVCLFYTEALYMSGDSDALTAWLSELQESENTWAGVIESDLVPLAGTKLTDRFYEAFSMGRSVDWKIHLYFEESPIMEFRLGSRHTHFAILLPQRMRPGMYWGYTSVTLQIVLPMVLMFLLSVVIYRHVMGPLNRLERATHAFSQGNLDVRVRHQLGRRNDELSALGAAFDKMADRIGDLLESQRQLIADLSHELRTPLTRLEIALGNLANNNQDVEHAERIQKECRLLRSLVEDTLTLAWLENERPLLNDETLDLVDLLDVIAEDARFEFPKTSIALDLPNMAEVKNSNHVALGQAIENVVRNAMRYTPVEGSVLLRLAREHDQYVLHIDDEGPGVPNKYLESIFKPFFRVDAARTGVHNGVTAGFGLGLALAVRQLASVGARIRAENRSENRSIKGLRMILTIPLINPDM